jgi:hypothetical protein
MYICVCIVNFNWLNLSLVGIHSICNKFLLRVLHNLLNKHPGTKLRIYSCAIPSSCDADIKHCCHDIHYTAIWVINQIIQDTGISYRYCGIVTTTWKAQGLIKPFRCWIEISTMMMTTYSVILHSFHSNSHDSIAGYKLQNILNVYVKKWADSSELKSW